MSMYFTFHLKKLIKIDIPSNENPYKSTSTLLNPSLYILLKYE